MSVSPHCPLLTAVVGFCSNLVDLALLCEQTYHKAARAMLGSQVRGRCERVTLCSAVVRSHPCVVIPLWLSSKVALTRRR